MGGSAVLGIKASMTYRPVTLEASADQVMGRAATLYPLTVNAVLDMARPQRVVPFAIVGGGLFLTVPSNSVGDETVSTMGLNFGGGLRFYINRFLGVRFETKQLFTRVANRLEAEKREELLIFQSSSLGVIFAFD
jgi:opacity protein-like surface antigen